MSQTANPFEQLIIESLEEDYHSDDDFTADLQH